MAYIKTDWEDGDVISEAGLDHLENGVYNNSVAIGDLADLDTTDKTNLVAAINEAAQSGGGSGGMSNAVKDALLQLASKVAYIDDDGQDYYDDLYDALYPAASIVSIQADYTQTGTVYPTTSLEDLRNDLAVSAIYDNGSVVPVISYMLSGTLTVGTSTVTVTYSGFTDTFDVTVSAAPTVSSIAAVYTQSGTVYDTDSLDSLKADLVVTATYTDSSTETVPSTDYTLSGTLAAGTSTITVTYSGKTTTFNVTVTGYLPTGYTLLQALTSTGTQYIDTGVQFTNEMKYEIEVSGLVRNATANTCAIGAFSSGSTYMMGIFLYADNAAVEENRVRAWFRGNPSSQSTLATNGVGFIFDTNTKYKCAQKGNKAWVDDVQLINTFTDVTFTIPQTVVLFGRNSATSGIGGLMPCTIYGVNFYDASNTLIHQFVPCLDDNNVPCMYDRVGEQTYYNGGTGTFNYIEVA